MRSTHLHEKNLKGTSQSLSKTKMRYDYMMRILVACFQCASHTDSRSVIQHTVKTTTK